MSNFDLLDAVKNLPIKHFRGVFNREQLPEHPNIPETGIINLDDHDGPGTHWTGYGISPSSVIYFDSYGLPPPREFAKYVSELNIPVWYSTLPTQTITDPPICGREVLNALSVISNRPEIHTAVHEYTIKSSLKRRSHI